MSSVTAVERRVRAGAKMLDRVAPGWAALMTEDLDILDCTHCVLGHLYGTYWRGVKHLIDQDVLAVGMSPADYGLDAGQYLRGEEWGSDNEADPIPVDWEKNLLQKFWLNEIALRGGYAAMGGEA